MKKTAFLSFLLLVFSFSFAEKNIDSLIKALPLMEDDTAKAQGYVSVAKSYLGGDHSERALPYLLKSLEVCQKIGYDKGIAATYGHLGGYYYSHSDFKTTIKYWLLAIKFAENKGDIRVIASLNNNIGLVYMDQGTYERSEEYLLRGLELRSKEDRFNELSGSYNNLGLLYFKMAHNEADAQKKKELLDKSEKNYSSAIRIREEKVDSFGLAGSYGNLATLLLDKGDKKRAIELGKKSLQMYRKLDVPYEVLTSLIDLGEIYISNKMPESALPLAEEALQMTYVYQVPDMRRNSFALLTRIYAMQGQYVKAHEVAMDLVAISDTLYNAENYRQINEMQTVYETEKKENDNKLLSATNDLQKKEIASQETKKKYLIWIVALVLLGAVFAVVSYLRSKKQNRRLAAFNAQVSRQKIEIEKQKEIVDTKNKEVLDSIQYAGKIQNAIFPSQNEFQNLGMDAFVFFRPKDIISGDFFWIQKREDFVFYATADCTGHGVPGALMSMLGAALLNEIVNEKGVSEPCAVLDLMRDKIISSLKQQETKSDTAKFERMQDGMDMVLCRLDTRTKTLVFSAAQNPVWIIKDEKWTETFGEKQPIGLSPSEPRPFTQHTVQLSGKDCVYTFSDGYADQFGGPKGKKFKYKPMAELINKNHSLPVAEQKILLGKAFDDWRGDFEQVDDVLVIGLRI